MQLEQRQEMQPRMLPEMAGDAFTAMLAHVDATEPGLFLFSLERVFQYTVQPGDTRLLPFFEATTRVAHLPARFWTIAWAVLSLLQLIGMTTRRQPPWFVPYNPNFRVLALLITAVMWGYSALLINTGPRYSAWGIASIIFALESLWTAKRVKFTRSELTASPYES